MSQSILPRHALLRVLWARLFGGQRWRLEKLGCIICSFAPSSIANGERPGGSASSSTEREFIWKSLSPYGSGNPGGLKRRRASAMLARRHRESHQYRRVTSSLLAATGAERSQIRGPDFPSSTVTSTVNWRTGIERKSPDKDKSAGRGHGNLQYIFNPKSHFGLGNQRILAS